MRSRWRKSPVPKRKARWAKQPFKLDLLQDIDDDSITQCTHAEFTDLCRGGHVNDTGEIPAFKPASIAGAYWRGSEKNPQPWRVYGRSSRLRKSWPLTSISSKRRGVGTIAVLAAASSCSSSSTRWGLAMLCGYPLAPQSAASWSAGLKISKSSVATSTLSRRSLLRELYVRSGHWAHYQDAMYPSWSGVGEVYCLRPMNCPHHIMIFASEQHSYRALPIRIAELGNMHRWEKSGQVSGMSRVRSMTLNDAHIFCADVDMVEREVEEVLRLMEEVYGTLGLNNYAYRLSLGDPDNQEK